MFASAFTLATFALASLSSVTAVPTHAPHAHIALARRSEPAGWPSNLENYDVYHTRYLALKCQDKHDTDYFNSCCIPMGKSQKLSSRPDKCDPAKLNDDEGDCDDDEPTSTKKASSTPAPTSTKKTTTTKKANPTPAPTKFDKKGGQATFFFQNGHAGACGQKHPDSFPLVALTSSYYGSFSRASSHCGKKVIIRNTKNGKTVTATVADACPSCDGPNSLDLSTGAFDKLGSRNDGVLPIEWSFLE